MTVFHMICQIKMISVNPVSSSSVQRTSHQVLFIKRNILLHKALLVFHAMMSPKVAVAFESVSKCEIKMNITFLAFCLIGQ